MWVKTRAITDIVYLQSPPTTCFTLHKQYKKLVEIKMRTSSFPFLDYVVNSYLSVCIRLRISSFPMCSSQLTNAQLAKAAKRFNFESQDANEVQRYIPKCKRYQSNKLIFSYRCFRWFCLTQLFEGTEEFNYYLVILFYQVCQFQST